MLDWPTAASSIHPPSVLGGGMCAASSAAGESAESVSQISGRGVGMDAVRATLEALGGTVEFATRPGEGSCTTLTVPITAAVQRVLLLEIGAECVAFPVAGVYFDYGNEFGGALADLATLNEAFGYGPVTNVAAYIQSLQ